VLAYVCIGPTVWKWPANKTAF